ncbi:hypothetical protein CYMTET_40535 [Cymbomonas tetramitiformis]|uniref:Uncharacterized protein n=1 Tax=Cymbomonas tetramitiformis TaxID=36881 RepID=A0AAE0C7Y1_9CHLO|nr:hypothetical protein CYMTET_40535 [Cymbomonas tetramitiformis]
MDTMQLVQSQGEQVQALMQQITELMAEGERRRRLQQQGSRLRADLQPPAHRVYSYHWSRVGLHWYSVDSRGSVGVVVPVYDHYVSVNTLGAFRPGSGFGQRQWEAGRTAYKSWACLCYILVFCGDNWGWSFEDLGQDDGSAPSSTKFPFVLPKWVTLAWWCRRLSSLRRGSAQPTWYCTLTGTTLWSLDGLGSFFTFKKKPFTKLYIAPKESW